MLPTFKIYRLEFVSCCLPTPIMLTPFHAIPPGLAVYVVPGLLLYILLARWLRWRNYVAIHKKFEAKFLNKGLTKQDAQEIVQISGMWDMPELLYSALSYATIKTYAIVAQSFSLSQVSTYARLVPLCSLLYPKFYSQRSKSPPRIMHPDATQTYAVFSLVITNLLMFNCRPEFLLVRV